jgi:hypothetical protein
VHLKALSVALLLGAIANGVLVYEVDTPAKVLHIHSRLHASPQTTKILNVGQNIASESPILKRSKDGGTIRLAITELAKFGIQPSHAVVLPANKPAKLLVEHNGSLVSEGLSTTLAQAPLAKRFAANKVDKKYILSEALEQWAAINHWTMQWKLPVDYPISASFYADIARKEPLQTLSKYIPKINRSLILSGYTGDRIFVVSSKVGSPLWNYVHTTKIPAVHIEDKLSGLLDIILLFGSLIFYGIYKVAKRNEFKIMSNFVEFTDVES